MLNQLILARAVAQTAHVDLVVAGQRNCQGPSWLVRVLWQAFGAVAKVR